MFALAQAPTLNRTLAPASALSARLRRVTPVHARCGGCPLPNQTPFGRGPFRQPPLHTSARRRCASEQPGEAGRLASRKGAFGAVQHKKRHPLSKVSFFLFFLFVRFHPVDHLAQAAVAVAQHAVDPADGGAGGACGGQDVRIHPSLE